ncbi:hypothetical protein FH972_025107 [Carpinus fangiana]|uniref:Uncharacterized protein n=1 Tax=Carpinus fangiana TaxID=176857 RepID=A0A5N6L021_9ROSI|nr:hypothetical protein FH972_025107 [Carpinus fangiana]
MILHRDWSRDPWYRFKSLCYLKFCASQVKNLSASKKGGGQAEARALPYAKAAKTCGFRIFMTLSSGCPKTTCFDQSTTHPTYSSTCMSIHTSSRRVAGDTGVSWSALRLGWHRHDTLYETAYHSTRGLMHGSHSTFAMRYWQNLTLKIRLRRHDTRHSRSSTSILTCTNSQGQGAARRRSRQDSIRASPQGCPVIPPDHHRHPRRPHEDQRLRRTPRTPRPRGAGPDQEGCQPLQVHSLQ